MTGVGKGWLQITLVVLLIVLMITGLYIGINYSSLNALDEKETIYSHDQPPSYHFMVVVDDRDEQQIEKIHQGMVRAAKEYKVVFEFWPVSTEASTREMEARIDIAIRSKLDGIIIQPDLSQSVSDLLDEARKQGIPVITMFQDLPELKKVSHIAYNRYQVGNRLGQMLINTYKETGYQSGQIISFQILNQRANSISTGVKDQLGEAYQVIPIQLDDQQELAFNVADDIRSALATYPDVISIICQTSPSTLATIQVLKEINRVNEISVIGFEEDDILIDYVNRGVLLTSVSIDYEAMGYEAIKQVYLFNENDFVPSYIDVDVQFLEKR